MEINSPGALGLNMEINSPGALGLNMEINSTKLFFFRVVAKYSFMNGSDFNAIYNSSHASSLVVTNAHRGN